MSNLGDNFLYNLVEKLNIYLWFMMKKAMVLELKILSIKRNEKEDTYEFLQNI